MQRTRQILSHGWLGRTVTVLTLGYYPVTTAVGRVAVGRVCATFAFTLPSVISSMPLPLATGMMSTPAVTGTVEHCP